MESKPKMASMISVGSEQKTLSALSAEAEALPVQTEHAAREEEAAAELAACKAAAPWAFCAPEPLAKTPSKEAVATTWAVTTCSE